MLLYIVTESCKGKWELTTDVRFPGSLGTGPVTADASTIAAAVPDASYFVIEDASHFSMFGVCKPAAEQAALEAEIEDPICSDGTSLSRSAIHAVLFDRVEAAFRDGLGRTTR